MIFNSAIFSVASKANLPAIILSVLFTCLVILSLTAVIIIILVYRARLKERGYVQFFALKIAVLHSIITNTLNAIIIYLQSTRKEIWRRQWLWVQKIFKVLVCILSHRNATDEEKRRSQKGFVEEKVELYEELAELNK